VSERFLIAWSRAGLQAHSLELTPIHQLGIINRIACFKTDSYNFTTSSHWSEV
jgi:hypothetical protein